MAKSRDDYIKEYFRKYPIGQKIYDFTNGGYSYGSYDHMLETIKAENNGKLPREVLRSKEELKDYLMKEHGFTDRDAEAILNEYSQDYLGQGGWTDYLRPSKWGMTTDPYDTESLFSALDEFLENRDKFVLPELPDKETLRKDAEAKAEDDFNENYNSLENLYNTNYETIESTLNDLYNANVNDYNQLYNANTDLFNTLSENTRSELQNQLLENNAMFGDYRNQLLTSNAMNNQAIAGSTRYELERSQRNAISRGASAAQRLVASINTQLGTQAQAAQQSLDTSNALAQQLLAQRQAATQLRGQYLDSQNQLASNQLSSRNQLASKLSANRNNITGQRISNLSNRDSNLAGLQQNRILNLETIKNSYGDRAVRNADEAYQSNQARYDDLINSYDGVFGSVGQHEAARKRYNNNKY